MSVPAVPLSTSTLPQGWRATAGRLLRLGEGSAGNELTTFVDGDGAFSAMLAAIHSAQKRIWFEVYIFAHDALGQRFLAALTAAAARGVEVKLLVDAVGSSDLRAEHLLPLRTAGGVAVHFNDGLLARFWPFSSRKNMPRALRHVLSFAVRDHRKIMVVDDDDGFCGGMNISCDYGGPALGNGLFRDTHLLISGPAVTHLAAMFARSWRHATGVVLDTTTSTPPPPRPEGSHVQILGSDRFLRRRLIQRALYTAVTRAERSILLTTPYFVPPPRLLTALRRAAGRGVDVQVLTAGVSDVPIARIAARHLYSALLESGVRVWELKGQTLHAKTAVIDGFYAHVGSFNLDRWSYDRNLEVVAMTLDMDFASGMEAVFQADVDLSTEIRRDEWRRRSWLQRVVDYLAWQLARL